MGEQTRSRNFLELPVAEFKRATKIFARKRMKLGPALLAFEGGFLSIESGEATAVMRAEGEWHGRAVFSPEILRAVATVPPCQDPLPIAYAEGHLLIGSLSIPCQWKFVSEALIQNAENPSLVELLALNRTLSRADMMGSNLGRRIKAAVGRAEKRIQKAADLLEELGVTTEEIGALVEAKIQARLKS